MSVVRVEDPFINGDRTISYFDIALPLCKVDENGSPLQLLGTCFPIGRSIYVTAAHLFPLFEAARNKYKRLSGEKAAPTLEEMLQRLQWMKEDRFAEGIDAKCGALVVDQGAVRRGKLEPLGLSLVTGVMMALDFDLAVLLVEDDKRLNVDGKPEPIVCLSLSETPQIGQKIAVIGFPGKTNRLTVTDEGDKSKYLFGLSLVVEEGEIKEMHPVMRDLGNGFFPCLSTTADTKHGHSGGPVICTKTLSVVGVNSLGGISGGLVTWIGKALDVELVAPSDLKIGDQTLAPGETTTLRKMDQLGLIKIYDT